MKLKVRVNIHGIVTVASASLVEKKQEPGQGQSEGIEMENANEGQGPDAGEASADTSSAEANGPDGAEVSHGGRGEPQRHSWTQRVGNWLSGVRVRVPRHTHGVCCPPPLPIII